MSQIRYGASGVANAYPYSYRLAGSASAIQSTEDLYSLGMAVLSDDYTKDIDTPLKRRSAEKVIVPTPTGKFHCKWGCEFVSDDLSEIREHERRCDG
jgi:hypothetical protein